MRGFGRYGTAALIVCACIEIAQAAPSGTYWTPETPDLQPEGVLNIGVNNYFTVFRKLDNGGGALPTDTGLTIGILPFKKLQMEIGVDLLEPADYPLYFNAKAGSPENELFRGSPALYVGIFNTGTKKGVTDQNVVYGVVGKTFPSVGRLSAGPYIGNRRVLVDGDGDKANKGFMIAFDHGFMHVQDKDGNGYHRVVFAADYASGRNAIGGGGFGLYYYFTKDISLLTGPVWFNDEAVNGKWKWSILLNINVPVTHGR